MFILKRQVCHKELFYNPMKEKQSNCTLFCYNSKGLLGSILDEFYFGIFLMNYAYTPVSSRYYLIQYFIIHKKSRVQRRKKKSTKASSLSKDVFGDFFLK